MEAYLFFFLLTCTNMQVASADTSLSNLKSADTLTVRQKENITLQCDITGHEDVAWYLLSSDRFTLLISARKTRTRKGLPVYYNKDESRFALKPDSEINTAIFTIFSLTEDDEGLYFCGTAAKPTQLHFGNGIRLQFEDKSKDTQETFSTQKPHEEEVENSGAVSVCERVVMFGGVGVVTLLLILTTVVACSVIKHGQRQS
ncbi:uncharacterized protein LOC128634968 [Ictalurus punctatus]|uniref:Uncharacterized protein LOC128634968 n=1 Tax=Ictalurus punctatus TaxID=7998 RepID=A0A9F7TLT6_ICTPU|nr:uncharacterized protein LOC128634968 [Ictalurus punctatus]